jgi:hypothetical protein
LLALLFIKVNQAIVSLVKAMSFPFKCGMYLLINETFARKNERYIALLIEENLARSERIFMRSPTHINSKFRSKVRS